MKNILRWITTWIPSYAIFPLLFSFSFNCLVYTGTKVIARGWHHFNIESSLDLKIPFVPQFLIIYLGCYLFWIVNYILISRQDKQSMYQFFTADFLSRCICFLIFLIIPTTNTRPTIIADNIWNQLALWVYSIDSAENLFPSIHCLVSWFCYLGIRGRKEIPSWYQRMSMVIAFLVFASTIFTKQHVLVDVVGGILLAEICFFVARKTTWYQKYEKIGTKIEQGLMHMIKE